MDLVVVVFGFGVGILVGLTGIGGGSLMTPLLILVIGIKPIVAIGTDLAYGAITKTLGGWRHWRKRTVDAALSLWMALGSVPGAVTGVAAVGALHDRYGNRFDDTVLIILGIALVAVAVATLVRNFMPSQVAQERPTALLTYRTKVTAITLGAVLGFILGFTSVGSGALIGLAFILVFRLSPQRVVGTDVFHAAILLWVAGLAHLAVGNVDIELMANILLGSLPGVWVGAGLVTRVSARTLRPVLTAVLLASALAVLDKGGVSIPVPVLLGVPAVAGVLLALLTARFPGSDGSPSPVAARPTPEDGVA